MKFLFRSDEGPIVVEAEIRGPNGGAILRLALDTGATTTVIDSRLLVAAGYDPAVAPGRTAVIVAGGVQYAPRLAVERLSALGQVRTGLFVLSMTVPASSGIDGLLGLDFLRGSSLTIDFRLGQLELR